MLDIRGVGLDWELRSTIFSRSRFAAFAAISPSTPAPATVAAAFAFAAFALPAFAGRLDVALYLQGVRPCGDVGVGRQVDFVVGICRFACGVRAALTTVASTTPTPAPRRVTVAVRRGRGCNACCVRWRLRHRIQGKCDRHVDRGAFAAWASAADFRAVTTFGAGPAGVALGSVGHAFGRRGVAAARRAVTAVTTFARRTRLARFASFSAFSGIAVATTAGAAVGAANTAAFTAPAVALVRRTRGGCGWRDGGRSGSLHRGHSRRRRRRRTTEQSLHPSKEALAVGRSGHGGGRGAWHSQRGGCH